MKVLKFLLPILAFLILILYLVNPQLFRIIRYQTPLPDTYQHFPQRIMKASSDPLSFVEAPKGNLDTLRVKDGSGKLIPFSQYFEEGKLNAFLVIQQDSILYEKYSSTHDRSRLSNTFSVGKSMLSVLLGKEDSVRTEVERFRFSLSGEDLCFGTAQFVGVYFAGDFLGFAAAAGDKQAFALEDQILWSITHPNLGGRIFRLRRNAGAGRQGRNGSH